MGIQKSGVFQKYFVPGIVFQSIIIAGGYGTGRELIQYFMQYGALGGLLGMCAVSFALWAVVCAVSFEFARVFQTFDYKSFFQKLLGRHWWLYEVCYFALLVMVLAVVAASAGEILHAMFGLSYWTGVLWMMAGVGLLVLGGSERIEKFLSCWSFVLYAVYALFFVMCFLNFGPSIEHQLNFGEVHGGWALGGFKYAFYNLGIIPIVLFTTKGFTSRRDSVVAGVLAGVIGIVPGVLLYLSMLGCYPEIMNQALPVNYILELLQAPWLQYAFQIVLFGTLIETGTGYIYAVTDRFSATFTQRNKAVPRWLTPLITVLLLATGVFIAQFGLVDLVNKGYGTITWAFFFIYAVPVVTIGVRKLRQAGRRQR